MRLSEINKQFWSERGILYPWHATSPTSVDCRAVDAAIGVHNVSCVLTAGTRTWGFLTKADRDAFCEQFGGTAI